MGQITREFANTIGLGQTAQTGLNFRNYLINGDMNISQRGTSFTGLGNGDSAYTLDRWKWTEEGTITNEWTISQDTDVPTGEGFNKSLKIECTTADATLDADSIQYIEQRVEAQNLQSLKFGTSNARNLNLAFWIKSSKTGTYTINILNEDASRSYSRSFTIDSADTWIKRDINFDPDTVGSINNDNGTGLYLQFNLAAGTNKSSGSLQKWATSVEANRAPGQVNLADNTSNVLYLTGVQLERGKFDSDFEFLPYDVNLQRCKRYCQEFAPKVNDCRIATGECPTNNRCDPILKFSPEMRAAPSFTFSAANTFSIYSANTSYDLSSISLDSISSISGNLLCNVATTPFTGGSAGQFITNGTSSSILASAEL